MGGPGGNAGAEGLAKQANGMTSSQAAALGQAVLDRQLENEVPGDKRFHPIHLDREFGF